MHDELCLEVQTFLKYCIPLSVGGVDNSASGAIPDDMVVKDWRKIKIYDISNKIMMFNCLSMHIKKKIPKCKSLKIKEYAYKLLGTV